MKQLFDEHKQRDEDALLDLIKYREAYDILMKYWDYFPDNDKNLINEQLEKLGL